MWREIIDGMAGKQTSSVQLAFTLAMIFRQTLDRIYSRRRRHNDWDFGYPLHKRIIRRIENANKILWTGILGKILGVRNVPHPIDPTKINSILFIRNDAIGDMVLTTPLWHSIRMHFPHIRIGVVASIRNRKVIEHDPNMDKIFDGTAGDLRRLWHTKKEIAKDKWDIVVPMNYSRKTRIAILAKFLAPKSLSTTLVRPGESLEKRKKLFSICVTSPYKTEEIEMIEQMRIHLTGLLKIDIKDEEWVPVLYPDPIALENVNERVRHILNADATSHYIHINLEARTTFREYGVEHSFELSQQLIEEFPEASILWTASPQASRAVKAHLEANDVFRVHFFETSNIQELFALVKGAALVVTPDTSVVHIASAFKRPIVALYPLVHEWPPYKTPYRLLLPERQQPVSTIPVAEVMGACRELLQVTIPIFSTPVVQ